MYYQTILTCLSFHPNRDIRLQQQCSSTGSCPLLCPEPRNLVALPLLTIPDVICYYQDQTIPDVIIFMFARQWHCHTYFFRVLHFIWAIFMCIHYKMFCFLQTETISVIKRLPLLACVTLMILKTANYNYIISL